MSGGFAARADALQAARWAADRWGRLRCLAAFDETHDVRTFVLAPEDGSHLAFDPGQFMTFRTAVDGETAERCCSLSSSAAVGDTVSITVKRKPGGRMSGHLNATLAPGATIEAFGPAGRFGPVEAKADKSLLVTGGSGVTPVASIVRTAADLGIDLDAVFLHCARLPADVIFADEFPRLARRLLRLARRLLRLRPIVAASRPGEGWTGERGRICAELLHRLVPDLPSRTVLCCGPEGFMAIVRAMIAGTGSPPARYVEESFHFEDDQTPYASEAPIEAKPRQIRFAETGRTFTCPPGSTILRAAKAAGVAIPFSCAKGVCGTCKSLKLSGTVTMTHGGGIRQREIDCGFILPCSSRPETDVVLDR